MSFENSSVFNKENLDTYLKALGKEYSKLGGRKMPAELILIGGAAILENYGFRDMTTDVDAIIQASSVLKDAIRKVSDTYHLPHDWLNADFVKTASYSDKLIQYSVHYRTFYGSLNVRTVTAEYLIAMKLRSGRKYKNDLSDIIGILAEHEKRGSVITYEQIDTAVVNLYGSWDSIPDDSVAFIKDTLAHGRYEEVYQTIRNSEKQAKETLLEFSEEYPDALKESNVEDVLNSLKARKKERTEDH